MIFIMPLDSLFALVGLTIATAITPGPNNAMVAASGACFGYRRTIPHILGISLGFGFMIFCVGAFLGEIFQQSWLLREGLRWAGVGLLIYVAWRTATTHRIGSQDPGRKPFTFLQAAAFQWLNPKGWAMSIAVTSQFILTESPMQSALLVGLVFSLVGICTASSWTALGQAIGRLLEVPSRLIWFNRTMGLMILGCVVFLF